MRKRVFLPIFTLLIFFPFLVYVISYTRLFNDEVASLLTKIVDEQTNARLYMGKIHGSILGSFRIDGAALMYRDRPIALVDTIKISHLPLSIITKTVKVLQTELVNPKFYLLRSKDGTFNVDHIGKGPAKPGGKFDWFVILKNLKIDGGEFTFYDSTKESSVNSTDTIRSFDPYNFKLGDIGILASANISDDNLSASIKNISFGLDPVDLKINSMKFDFFASDAGTEISGLEIKSDLAKLEGDFTLTGQNVLDSIDITHFRQKHITTNLEAKDIDLRQLEKFVKLPINPVSKVELNCYASGDLDTLFVKQFSLRTDSSFVPLSAAFYNAIDSSMSMRVETRGAMVNSSELSAMLYNVGMPDVSNLKTIFISAVAEGHPSELKINMALRTGRTEISGDANSHGGLYNGTLKFHDLNLGELLKTNSLNTILKGGVEFALRNSSASLPEGKIMLHIDSSSVEQALIQGGTINLISESDSLNVVLNFLTSKGNISGTASLDVPSKAYESDLSFSEFDISSFFHIPSLNGASTGRLTLSGKGLDIDSLDSKLLVILDHSTLGDVPINNSAFTFNADTKDADKNLRLNSPFVDASITGNFVPDKLPSQLSTLFSVLADSFSNKVTGKHSTLRKDSTDISDLNALINVNVKDARFIGRLLGVSELYGDPEGQLNISSGKWGISLDGSIDADTICYVKDSLQIEASKLNTRFNLNTDNRLSVWNFGKWSVNTDFCALNINQTYLASKILRIDYASTSYSGNDSISITAMGQVDSIADFYIDASGSIDNDSIGLTSNTLLGKFFGVSLTSNEPVHIVYSPEMFSISPSIFSAGLDGSPSTTGSRVTVGGQYSLENGANLLFKFNNIALASLQKIGHIDSSSMKLNGEVNGDAALAESPSGVTVLVNFNGTNIDYNGSKSKLVDGDVKIYGNYLELSAQLSKPSDSSWYALRIDGTIPFSDSSSRRMQLKITTDSLNISFLAPFLSGVDNLEGVVTGNMTVTGRYSLPEFNGDLQVAGGKLKLAANQITYPFEGTIAGEGDKLVLNPVTLKNTTGQLSTAMIAKGSLEIQNNTIASFDIDLDGSLLVLNSTSRKSNQEIYGTAIAGSALQVLS